MISEIYVPMEGVPKGSKKAFYVKQLQRAVITDQNGQALKSYESTISAYAKDEGMEPVDGPISVTVYFVRSPKKSAPKTFRPHVLAAPDVDKMLRAVLDGLQGFAYKFDSQVCHVEGFKLTAFGEKFKYPGTYITVRSGKDIPELYPDLGEYSPNANITF